MDKLESVQESILRRLGSIDDRLAGVDVRLAGIDDRLAGIDVKFAGMSSSIALLQILTVGVILAIIGLSKAEIAELGLRLEAPLEHTWSCYDGNELPCEGCDSCVLRARGFEEAGIPDPLMVRLGRA